MPLQKNKRKEIGWRQFGTKLKHDKWLTLSINENTAKENQKKN